MSKQTNIIYLNSFKNAFYLNMHEFSDICSDDNDKKKQKKLTIREDNIGHKYHYSGHL